MLANRLSADPSTRVLLIEAGRSDNSLMVSMPKGFAKLVTDTKYVRQFQTTQAEDSGVRPETWPRGVMLGGSSSLNGMHYSRGQPQDFDGWAESGLHRLGLGRNQPLLSRDGRHGCRWR